MNHKNKSDLFKFLISYLNNDIIGLKKIQHQIYTEMTQRRACGSAGVKIVSDLQNRFDSVENQISALDDCIYYLNEEIVLEEEKEKKYV